MKIPSLLDSLPPTPFSSHGKVSVFVGTRKSDPSRSQVRKKEKKKDFFYFRAISPLRTPGRGSSLSSPCRVVGNLGKRAVVKSLQKRNSRPSAAPQKPSPPCSVPQLCAKSAPWHIWLLPQGDLGAPRNGASLSGPVTCVLLPLRFPSDPARGAPPCGLRAGVFEA